MSWFNAPAPLLPDLVEHNGRWLAGEPALIDGATRLTWRDFAQATARIANGLASLGVQPQERVAVLMDCRLETVLAMFGIVRAGAVAVPLNVSITDAAVAGMCADAACVAVFASGAHCARIDRLRAAGALSARHFIGCDAPAEGWRDFAHFIAPQSAAAPGGRDCGRRRMQPHLQLWNHRAAEGHRSYPCRAACIGPMTARSRCVIGAAAARCSRSGCSRTSAGSACSRRSSSAERSCCSEPSARATRSSSSSASRSRTARSFRVQLERLLAYPQRAAHRTASLETLMCCGSPLAADVKLRLCARIRLRTHRTVRPYRGAHHDPRTRGSRAQTAVGRQAGARRRDPHHRRGRPRGRAWRDR